MCIGSILSCYCVISLPYFIGRKFSFFLYKEPDVYYKTQEKVRLKIICEIQISQTDKTAEANIIFYRNRSDSVTRYFKEVK